VRDARDDAARQRTLQRINAVLHEARGSPDRDLDPKQ
jgi:hypothetical protein